MLGFVKFLNDQSGATSIEYSLIAAFIGLAIITAAIALGVEVRGAFESVQQGFDKRPAM